MATQIPEWVSPDNIIFCKRTLFVPSSVRQPKPGTQRPILVVAGNGEAFKLAHVRLARPADIYHAETYIDSSGIAIKLQARTKTKVILSHPEDNQSKVAVGIPESNIEFDLAVSNFCRAFDGRIADDFEQAESS